MTLKKIDKGQKLKKNENCRKSLSDQTNSISIPGCSYSKQSFQIYANLERLHGMITVNLFKADMLLISLISLFSGMMPISYAIFGCPQPQSWILPVPIQ